MRVSLTALWIRGKSCKPNAEDIPIYTMLRRSRFKPSDNRKAMLGKLSERIGGIRVVRVVRVVRGGIGNLEKIGSLGNLGVIGMIGIIGRIGQLNVCGVCLITNFA